MTTNDDDQPARPGQAGPLHFMYPTSETSDLTPEQCRLLDETLFQSNPTAYWRSRIDMLLREPGPVDYSTGLAADVTSLGLDPQMLATTEPTQAEREMQRALDAFALRHHIAESLVRLVHAVLTAGDDRDVSVWALMAGGPDSGAKVVKEVLAFQEAGVPAVLFIPADEAARYQDHLPADLETAVRMHWTWVQRAMDLLISEGLDANAGNNKLKHGFAVLPHDRLRIEFTQTPPNADGTMPKSAFANSLPVVDSLAVEFLERLRNWHPHAGSWEVTVLNLRPAELLAEALMLCIVWSSVFASTASRRVVDKDKAGPPHVGMVMGPAPEAIVRKPLGLRQGLTASKNGDAPRPLTVATRDVTVELIRTGPGTQARVVDD